MILHLLQERSPRAPTVEPSDLRLSPANKPGVLFLQINLPQMIGQRHSCPNLTRPCCWHHRLQIPAPPPPLVSRAPSTPQQAALPLLTAPLGHSW